MYQIFLISLLVLYPMQGWSESHCKSCGELRVLVKGLKSNQGRVRFKLFASQESYHTQEHAYREAFVDITGTTSLWVVKNLPLQEYAVVIYHDENNNQEFDTHLFGIPKESYGFSNNIQPKLAKPEFNKVKFDLHYPATQIEIEAQ